MAKAQVTMPVYLTNDKNPKCFIPKNNIYDLGNISTEYSSPYILCNLDIFQKSSNNIGFINAREDSDGILRRLAMFIRYKNYFIPSFGLANLMSLDKINVQKSKVSILNHSFDIDENSNVLLNFYDKKWYKTISMVYKKLYARTLLLFLGATAFYLLLGFYFLNLNIYILFSSF
ncbi:MAG: CHASE2 domain-containing protein [Epsilonproteobacteria bacterium]|nr:CHASE2 domain-containing protein [Campylobacterota bacterium]